VRRPRDAAMVGLRLAEKRGRDIAVLSGILNLYVEFPAAYVGMVSVLVRCAAA
jgi:hypothetical protein